MHVMNIFRSKEGKKFDMTGVNKFTAILVFIVSLCFLEDTFLGMMPFEKGVETVLALIVGYFVFHAVFLHAEQSELIETTNENLKNLVDHIGILTIIKSPEDYYKRLKHSIEYAEDSVSLLYLTRAAPTSIGKYAMNYWKWLQGYIVEHADDGVVVRRIASLHSQEKTNWIINTTVALAKVSNYGIRVYNETAFPPIMGMEIIDKKKVFLFGPHGKTPRWIYIDNPDVAEGMVQYFEDLWAKTSEYEIKALGDDKVSDDSVKKVIEKCLSPVTTK